MSCAGNFILHHTAMKRMHRVHNASRQTHIYINMPHIITHDEDGFIPYKDMFVLIAPSAVVAES